MYLLVALFTDLSIIEGLLIGDILIYCELLEFCETPPLLVKLGTSVSWYYDTTGKAGVTAAFCRDDCISDASFIDYSSGVIIKELRSYIIMEVSYDTPICYKLSTKTFLTAPLFPSSEGP